VLALVGNMVVCAVVFTSIRKWTVTNFFIVNMAAGDILMAFFCIPFTFLPTYVLLYWPFGATMCRIVSFSQAVSVFVSAYTMVAISSDRYLAIVYPLRPRMTRKQAKVCANINVLYLSREHHVSSWNYLDAMGIERKLRRLAAHYY
jgi:neuropeptide Y receptor